MKFQALQKIEKKTLIDIKQNSETSHIPCFLADWGYLKGSDRYNLSNEIKLLKIDNLEEFSCNLKIISQSTDVLWLVFMKFGLNKNFQIQNNYKNFNR